MIKRRKAPKRTRIKKVSQKDVPRLKRKLRSVLHPKIRERDGNRCFSCGKPDLEGSGWHAGHMFSAGGHSNIEFHPDNIHSQCYNCNINRGGNGAVYAARFIEQFGKPKFDSLYGERLIVRKWYSWELEELILAAEGGIEGYTKLYYEKFGPDLNAVPKK